MTLSGLSCDHSSIITTARCALGSIHTHIQLTQPIFNLSANAIGFVFPPKQTRSLTTTPALSLISAITRLHVTSLQVTLREPVTLLANLLPSNNLEKTNKLICLDQLCPIPVVPSGLTPSASTPGLSLATPPVLFFCFLMVFSST